MDSSDLVAFFFFFHYSRQSQINIFSSPLQINLGTSNSLLKLLSPGYNFSYFTVGSLEPGIYEYPWGILHAKRRQDYTETYYSSIHLSEIQLNYFHHQKLSRIHNKQRSLLVASVSRERMA